MDLKSPIFVHGTLLSAIDIPVYIKRHLWVLKQDEQAVLLTCTCTCPVLLQNDVASLHIHNNFGHFQVNDPRHGKLYSPRQHPSWPL